MLMKADAEAKIEQLEERQNDAWQAFQNLEPTIARALTRVLRLEHLLAHQKAGSPWHSVTARKLASERAKLKELERKVEKLTRKALKIVEDGLAVAAEVLTPPTPEPTD